VADWSGEAGAGGSAAAVGSEEAVRPGTAGPTGWVTRITRLWILAPFARQLARRQRERTLLEQLAECLGILCRDPRQVGLHLETLAGFRGISVLSARIDRAFRLILVPLAPTEVGLLYFDNHEEAYRWVDQHREQIPTMLTRVRELQPAAPPTAWLARPVVRATADDPIALTAAEDFRAMVDTGVAHYLTYLDDSQRRLVDLRAEGLLLVKGGAGTGKTVVAIHRILAMARQPPLTGPRGILYLCFNRLLAESVRELLTQLSAGALPPEIEVKTFHGWSGEYCRDDGGPHVDHDACQQAVFRAFRLVTQADPSARDALGELDGRAVEEEIVQVIKPNGLTALAEYLGFNRRGRPVRLRQTAREAIWRVYERAQAGQTAAGVCYWCDVPLRALAALSQSSEPPRYRAIVVDEGQDCSPVMIRLARRLLDPEAGQLTVFADPAQAMFQNGFQWTQQELRVRGGNVHWLRQPYRTTREISALARPLLEGEPELAADLSELETPRRTGPPPRLLVADNRAKLMEAVATAVEADAAGRPPHQIGVLVARRAAVDEVAAVLRRRQVPVQVLHEPRELFQPSVKVATLQAVKGLDFPVVYLLWPEPNDLGGAARADVADTRHALYVALTRASEEITVALIEDRGHPLIERLGLSAAVTCGPRGRAFANTHGLVYEEVGD
jgi:hypothetical protein